MKRGLEGQCGCDQSYRGGTDVAEETREQAHPADGTEYAGDPGGPPAREELDPAERRENLHEDEQEEGEEEECGRTTFYSGWIPLVPNPILHSSPSKDARNGERV